MFKFIRNILVIILSYTILFSTWTFSFNRDTWKYNHTYKFIGVVWVGLDYYTIWKYESSDKPKKVIEHIRIPNKK